MDTAAEKYLEALRDINTSLTKGLETAIAVIENPERLNEQERQMIIAKLKELVEASQKIYGPEATKH